MRTVIYRLAHTQTSGAAGSAEVTIASAGRIVGFNAHGTVFAGAGNVAFLTDIGINQNAISSAGTNGATKEATLGSFRVTAANGGVGSSLTGFVPCNVPALAGAKLSLNTTVSGTTPSTQLTTCDVYFVEG